jgi:hypothetical protein
MARLILLLAVHGVLLSVAVEGFLAGRRDRLVPITLASGACFAGACWLMRRSR